MRASIIEKWIIFDLWILAWLFTSFDIFAHLIKCHVKVLILFCSKRWGSISFMILEIIDHCKLKVIFHVIYFLLLDFPSENQYTHWTWYFVNILLLDALHKDEPSIVYLGLVSKVSACICVQHMRWWKKQWPHHPCCQQSK